MRRIFVMMLTLCMMAGAACAEAGYVSVTELREQAEALGRWSQTYEAHGRTIAVDVPLIVPEVERVPVVQVSAPLGMEIPERLGLPVVEANGRHFTYEDANLLSYLNENNTSGEAMTVWCIDPQSKNRADFQVYRRTPLSQRLGSNWWYTRDVYYPYEIDPETTFAEENALSLAQAQNTLKRMLIYYYGEEYSDIEMDYIEVRGRARKKTGSRLDDLGSYKKDYPKGTYYLSFRQKFAGIPMYLFMGDKMLTTGEDHFSPEVAGKWSKIRGVSEFEYMDDDSFFLYAVMVKEETELVEDVPLASLDAVIGRLEQEIDDGHLRNVYALRLGYVCYLDEGSPDTFSLYPMWVCDCLYTESARKDIEIPAWSDEYREYFDYQQILIDAQTCEVIAGWVTEDEDLYHHDLITWDDL